MNKTIKITQQNIFEGEMANPQNCAIARAIKRNMKGKLMSISVLPSHVTLKINNKMFFAKMPKIGAAFIKRFDHSETVNPFELNLNFKKGYSLV